MEYADILHAIPRMAPMTKNRDQVLQNLVNGSGFVFQLGLEHRVRGSRSHHGWEVLSREHPWSDGTNSGFADIVLGQGIVRVVVECKRTRNGSWVFLVPDANEPQRRCRCQWSSHEPSKRDLFGWADFSVRPTSLESDFCIIRGQGEGDRSMLERLAAGLLHSLPPLAAEEANLRSIREVGTELIYVPVIVTTAALEVCRFAPEDIDVSTGTLIRSKFEPAKVIRFRKSLAHELTERAQPDQMRDLARDKERTVVLCMADHFLDFLKDLSVEADFYGSPWVSARRWEEQRP